MPSPYIPWQGANERQAQLSSRIAMARCMLVTGASRGIGAATARAAAREGYRVAINYRDSEAAATHLVEEIRSAGGEALAVQADVGDQGQVRRMFSNLDVRLGYVDVLVNNAGVLSNCRVDETDEGELTRIFRTNLFSAVYCSAEAVRRMSTLRGGRGGGIVNISSVAARLGGQSNASHYASTKGAMDTFTMALSREVGPEGIRVNAVRPGLIATDIFEGREGRTGIEARAATVPLGRVGAPDEVAQAVLWVASAAASFVHGAFIDVAGGR